MVVCACHVCRLQVSFNMASLEGLGEVGVYNSKVASIHTSKVVVSNL